MIELRCSCGGGREVSESDYLTSLALREHPRLAHVLCHCGRSHSTEVEADPWPLREALARNLSELRKAMGNLDTARMRP